MDPSPLRAGDPESLGEYRLLGRLGAGGQGTVFLARNGSGERVAVKLLNVDVGGDTSAREEFVREVSAARRVARFCTAQMLDVGVVDERPYIVSEYVEGPSLQQAVRGGGPRTGGALERLAIGVATALAAIHAAGVVHRDLKPANVLLGPDGPRVIDFGIARALDSTSVATAHVVGTPAYMAPEQIAGATIGPKADVFAWAGTMLYAANAELPFAGESIPATFHRILHGEPSYGRLSGPVREMVAAALAKDPAGRPSAGDLLLSLLSTATAAGGVVDAPVPVQRTPAQRTPAETVTAARTEVADSLLAEGATRALTAVGDGGQTVANAPTVTAGSALHETRPGPPPAPVQVAPPPSRREPWWRTRLVRWGVAPAVVLALAAAVVVWAFALRPGDNPADTSVDAIPAAFDGEWDGGGHMPSEGVDYFLHVDLVGGGTTGEFRASETGCLNGPLTFVSGTAERVELRFVPAEPCSPATVTMTRTSDTRLTYQIDPEDAAPTYGGDLAPA